MPRWQDAATALRDGIRREVFFFPSGGGLLFGSLYVAEEYRAGPTLLMAPGYGWEFPSTLSLCHAVAHRAALLGGAGMAITWPGHGDSTGAEADVTPEEMVQAIGDAVVEGSSRIGGALWGLGGVRLGAFATAVAASRIPHRFLLLLAPVTDPADHFRLLLGSGRPAGADADPDWALGHPVPRRVQLAARRSSGSETFREVRSRRMAITLSDALPAALPDGWPVSEVRGDWRTEARRGCPGLRSAAEAWLEEAPAGTWS